MSLKEFKNEIPIINVSYSVLVYDDPIELDNHFKDTKFDHHPSTFQGGVFELDNRFYLALHNNKELTAGIIAHESNHLVNQSFEWVNQELDVKNDELQCRFLQFIVDDVHKCLSTIK